ncbi:MAG: phenylacetate--CoA ligase family protein [Betaproteobacteria bacterium]|jgi:phenylacetate-CoA ligase|nr:phenylacetate--CoA ligase family protein [Betaproteobacteria bacterium]NDF64895.1 phenylacetate--CoA ligase family protein [Betaproteobacteria bacterium]
MKHLDSLETRLPQDREAALMAALPVQISHAQQHSAAFAGILSGVNAAAITSRTALASLPVTRKHELLERQQAQRATDPFGGFSTIGWKGLVRSSGARRVYQSPGPIYEPEGAGADYWRAARAMAAAGFEAGDLVHNCFSYHLTPGAWIMESGAHALGCTVIPGGVGNTEQQLAAVADLRPVAYSGTPSFLKILIEKATEAGQRLSITKAMVSGEACPPSLRDWFTQQGVVAYQCYATADVGLIAYETSAREGLVLDEGVIVEIVRPGTGDPVAEGEVGEVVVTVLNPDYPLIRFGTGDLSAVLPGACPTGRTNTRIKGWMGRADQTTKVRGMFVHPGQVDQVAKRFPAVLKARLVVTGEMANDQMTMRVESREITQELQRALADAVRDVTKLRAEVELVVPGTLPNDGKVIEDARSYK